MAYREVLAVEIEEIIRRWQAGLSERRIASGTGKSRPTVRRYVAAARALGLRPRGPVRTLRYGGSPEHDSQEPPDRAPDDER